VTIDRNKREMDQTNLLFFYFFYFYFYTAIKLILILEIRQSLTNVLGLIII